MINYLGKLTTIDKMIIDLRLRGVDEDNCISDEYLINEAYQIGEWDYI